MKRTILTTLKVLKGLKESENPYDKYFRKTLIGAKKLFKERTGWNFKDHLSKDCKGITIIMSKRPRRYFVGTFREWNDYTTFELQSLSE